MTYISAENDIASNSYLILTAELGDPWLEPASAIRVNSLEDVIVDSSNGNIHIKEQKKEPTTLPPAVQLVVDLCKARDMG